jgi:putative MATE family efflux protein
MRLAAGYGDIFKLSFPIMLGSAVQNVIALTDSVFLYHLSESDFAAIGFVGVYYLIIAGIGYGFSKGGQIIIARRYGQLRYADIGNSFYTLVVFELIMAVFMFLLLYFGSHYIFSLLLDSEVILQKSLEYIRPRSWGVFFSYTGVAFVALYTGIARTWFIVVDTLILAALNIVLNYGFIYGAWGLPALGIAGAGYASSIAEVVAFLVFLIYMFRDPLSRRLSLNKLPDIDLGLIKTMTRIGSPMVAQSIVGMGSWFVFFGLVENLGERALAITNLARIVYLVLSIPCWGFSSGINTLVSNTIGAGEEKEVWPVTWKTIKISMAFSFVLGIPILLFPKIFLYPLLGSEDMSLISEAQPIFYLLLVIVALFSSGIILLNALTGTGKTWRALQLQIYGSVAYLVYVIVVIKHTDLGLVWAWASEIVYWSIMIAILLYYLTGMRWEKLKG